LTESLQFAVEGDDPYCNEERGQISESPIPQALLLPNPATDHLNLILTIPLVGDWQITHIDGRILQSGRLSGAAQTEIPLVNLVNGLYNLRIQTENGLPYIFRFVIAK